jgi:penicillin-binding protein 1A
MAQSSAGAPPRTRPSAKTPPPPARRTPKSGGRRPVGKHGAKRGGKDGRSFLRRRWWLILLLTPVVLGVLTFVALAIAYSRIQLPDRLPPIQTTYLYDRDGEVLATLHGAVDRTIVDLSEMSPHVIDAVIATEDHEFYEHPGVDLRGIVRAAWTNLRGTDNEVQGASTITQQLVKNVYAGEYRTDPETGLREYVAPERSVLGKIREAMLAMKLEREFGKDRILQQYLNTVYFGHGAYGIEAAAQTYFGRPAARLTVLQAATLAGVLHAPELYDPIDRPADNRFRRDYSLDQMVRYGYLEQTEADALKAKKCCGTIADGQQDRIDAPGDAEYFVDHVRRALFDRYGSARVYGGGLRVTTSLDMDMQRAAEEAVGTALPDPEDPAAALVAIDNGTGQILAMVGGDDWERSKVNLATLPCEGCGRPTGSAFKPFTLAAAMQEGYDLDAYWYGPHTTAIEECPDPTADDGVWHPVNAEGEGNYTLADATKHSVNTIYAQLVAQLGPEKVVDMANALGIRSPLSPFCSITLGSVAVSPLEMTNAYATIAAHGVRRWATPLLQVETPTGRVDGDIVAEPATVLAPNDADLVTYALQGVTSSGGTGASANLGAWPSAGKTGTAKDTTDAWFCGYTVQITACVWVGYPEGGIPLEDIHGYSEVFGGTIPAAIWRSFMTSAMEGKDAVAFEEPSFEGYTVGAETPAPSPVPTLPPCSLVSPSPGVSPVPCITDSPSPSPEPTESPSPEPTESPSPEPTKSPSPEPTKSPKPSKSPTPTPTPTEDPSPTEDPPLG